MDDITSPLILLPDYTYNEEEVVPYDYFGQRFRGSEILSSDVQQFGDTNGQQS